MQNLIKEVSIDFFDKLGLSIKDLVVEGNEENIFTIRLKSEESGFLIGNHGKNLESIKNILKLILSKKLEKKIILHIEVNDYLKSKDDRLILLVKGKVDFINKTGKEIIMPVLSAYDRKKVHSYIAEFGGGRIYTKSIGEGEERRIHIYKMDSKVTLDIDGNDI